ncbi:MAG: hypothetical protein ACLPN1_13325 [Dissulfurispiraceae bacterium]
MKLHARFPLTPLAVLSGLNDPGTSIAALQKDSQDYLLKELASVDSIIRLIRYSIERQRLVTGVRSA